MNKIFLSLLLSACAFSAFAQPKIQEIKKLPLPTNVEASDPVISGDGSTVVVATAEGLTKIGLDDGSVTTLAGTKGAFEATLNFDGSSVAWQDATYDSRQRRHVAIKSASTAPRSKVQTVLPAARRVSSGMSFDQANPFASISYGHLQITDPDGTTRVIDPQGRGSYLWPQVSPDGQKVVYWKVGGGCFVCDIDGSNPRSLGVLRAAVWVGDDYVVGMLDEDDGYHLTASRLILSDLNGRKSILTDDSFMAVNPSASADGRRIVFNSAADNGIYLISLDLPASSAPRRAKAKAADQTVRFAAPAEEVPSMRRATSALSDLRIYINPGHGAWGPGDRPMNVYREENGAMVLHKPNTASGLETPQYPDTLAFYESNTDLLKCLGLLEYLRGLGIQYDPTLNQGDPAVIYASADVADQTRVIATNDWGAARDLRNNIVMSRVKNGPWPHTGGTDSSGTTVCNRTLSEVARECQDNNFDVFFAVHSDAGASTTGNHHLLLYRGYDDPSTERAGLTQTHQQLSRLLAELTWNHSYYLPFQEWNEGVTKYIKGDVNFYGTSQCGTAYGCYGYLGVLKHQVPGLLAEGYCHSYGPSRHRAMNPEVDAIEGHLYGRGIADYLGLQQPNLGNIYGLVRVQGETFSQSYFVPNTSTNDVFRPINGATVKLYDSANQLLKSYTTDNYYNGAFVFLNLEPGQYRITVEKSGYKSYAANINVSGGKDTLPEVFLESTGGASSSVYNITQDYADEAIPGIVGTVKRVVASGDYLYILSHDGTTPHLLAYNHKIRTAVGELGTDICEGEYLTLSDIGVTTDGVLLGINEAQQNKNETSGEQIGSHTKIYKWSNDADGCATGQAQLLYSIDSSAFLFKTKTGTSMAVYGSSTDGYLFFTAVNNYYETSDAMRIVRVSLANGSYISDRLYNSSTATPNTYTPSYFGNFLLLPTPSASTYMIIGSDPYPFAAQMGSNNAAPTIVAAQITSLGGNGYRYTTFTYDGKFIVAVPKASTVNLLNLSTSISSPSTVIATGFGGGGDIMAATAEGEGFAVIRMTNDGHLTKYSYSPTPVEEEDPDPSELPTIGEEPSDIDILVHEKRAPMAFNLRLESDGVVKYTLTEQAKLVNVALENTDSGVVTRFSAPTDKGENTFAVPVDQLTPNATFRWSVEVTGNPIENDERVFRFTGDQHLKMVYDSGWLSRVQAGGVQVISDPEADNFGYIVSAYGFGEGVRMFRPDDFSLMGNQAYDNASLQLKTSFYGSPYRIAQRGNLTYLTDYSDNCSDIRIFNPASPTLITSAYGSGITGPDGIGRYFRGSTFMGSTSLAIAFTGSGADTKMWIVAEDYTTADALLRYDIGNSEKIDVAPVMVNSQLSKSGLLSSQNTSLCPSERGLFIAQMTTTNTASKPALLFVGLDGTVLFNSGSSLSSLPGSATGVALNVDETMLAVSVPQEGVRLYSVTWNGNVPSFSYIRTVDGSNNYESEICQLQFDRAGNLYAFQRSPASLNAGICVYTLANTDPFAVTPAKAALTISGPVSDEVTGSGQRNELAYDLVYDSASNLISFTLTGDVPKVEIVYHNEDYGQHGTVIQDLGGLTAGRRSVIPDMLYKGDWDWTVRVHSAPVAESRLLLHEQTPVADARGGVLVINDRNAERQGYIVTSTGRGHGFKVYSPNLLHLESATHSAFLNDRNSPFHLEYYQGMVFATDWSSDGKNIYMFDPHNTSDEILSYFSVHGGVIGSSDAWNIDGWKVSGAPSDVAFSTVGDKEYMWMFTDKLSYTLNGTTYTGDVLARFELDDNGRIIGSSRTVFPQISGEGLFTNTVVSLFDTGSGLFVSQKRTEATSAKNTASAPAFVYIDYDGNILFNSGSSLTSLEGCGSGLALNSDLSLMAISDTYGRICFYSVEWNDNVPSFTRQELILGSKQAANTEVCQIDFDAADNLYAFIHHSTDTSRAGLYVYSLPTSMLVPQQASPAPRRVKSVSPVSGGVVVDIPSSETSFIPGNESLTDITDITDAAADASPEQWFTVDGRSVGTAPTAPGIYIVRSGATVRKVVVK